jgi:hypothetical protein
MPWGSKNKYNQIGVLCSIRNSHSINKEKEKSNIKVAEINIKPLNTNNKIEEVVEDFKNMI